VEPLHEMLSDLGLVEFGKLSELQGVDWTLPEDEDHPLGESPKLKIHLGSPTFADRNFLGKIYPRGTSNDQFLYFYSRQFDCIELNTSFYAIPDESKTSEWLRQVSESFLFCPKVFRGISHEQFGLADKFLLKQWLGFLENLGSHAGPSFIQLHENFSYESKVLLFRFLESWPRAFKLTLELRHPSWFRGSRLLQPLVDYLRNKDIGLVITDVAGRRDVSHASISSDWSMVRLIGNNLVESDEMRLHAWAQRLKSWEKRGLPEVFLFLHQPDDVMTVEFARLAKKIFSEYGFALGGTFELEKEKDLMSFID
jgi:uncharacterized protein YecE (DUF72 family)